MVVQKPLSPAMRKSLRELVAISEEAQAREKGQNILFQDSGSYRFPRPVKKEELESIRVHIYNNLGLDLEYTAQLKGSLLHSGSPEDLTPLRNEDTESYSMSVWNPKLDSGRLGLFFKAITEQDRISPTYFTQIIFTKDPTGNISPDRDDELRHQVRTSLDSYFSQNQI